MLLASLALAIALATPDTNPPALSDTTVTSMVAPELGIAGALADTIRRRPHAVAYSDAYAVRLRVHRIGSYAMLPLFAAEYALGQNLLNDSHPADWLKPAHLGVALGVGTLFTVNTVTGAWNFWEARHDPNDRVRRWLHASMMVASDAGFVWTGAAAPGSRHSTSNQRQFHKNVALGSIALSTAGTAMMWLWKN